MSDAKAKLLVPTPSRFSEAVGDATRPQLAGGADAQVSQWSSFVSPDGETLAFGCVQTPIPGWVEDLRPIVQARLTSITVATTERVFGRPVEPQTVDQELTFRTHDGARDGTVAFARTFLGWSDRNVVTCFAVCAGPVTQGSRPRHCDESVKNARMVGASPPPAPGFILGMASWAVHHPRGAAESFVTLVLLLGVLALATRRRPRSRI